MKILGPESVIWDQILDMWPQKGQPGNPATKVKVAAIFLASDAPLGSIVLTSKFSGFNINCQGSTSKDTRLL